MLFLHTSLAAGNANEPHLPASIWSRCVLEVAAIDPPPPPLLKADVRAESEWMREERMTEEVGGGVVGITKDLFCISHIICVPACHKEPLAVLTVHSQGRDSAVLFEQPFLSPAQFVLTLQFAL